MNRSHVRRFWFLKAGGWHGDPYTLAAMRAARLAQDLRKKWLGKTVGTGNIETAELGNKKTACLFLRAEGCFIDLGINGSKLSMYAFGGLDIKDDDMGAFGKALDDLTEITMECRKRVGVETDELLDQDLNRFIREMDQFFSIANRAFRSRLFPWWWMLF